MTNQTKQFPEPNIMRKFRRFLEMIIFCRFLPKPIVKLLTDILTNDQIFVILHTDYPMAILHKIKSVIGLYGYIVILFQAWYCWSMPLGMGLDANLPQKIDRQLKSISFFFLARTVTNRGHVLYICTVAPCGFYSDVLLFSTFAGRGRFPHSHRPEKRCFPVNVK